MNSRIWRVSLWRQARVRQQPGIEGRHAHHHRRGGQRREHRVQIELRQQDHAGARKQRDIGGDEQAVDVKNRQGVQQHILRGEAPDSLEAVGVGTEIAVAKAWRPWSGRWCRRCRGWRPDRTWRQRHRENRAAWPAASSISEPDSPSSSRVRKRQRRQCGGDLFAGSWRRRRTGRARHRRQNRRARSAYSRC